MLTWRYRFSGLLGTSSPGPLTASLLPPLLALPLGVPPGLPPSALDAPPADSPLLADRATTAASLPADSAPPSAAAFAPVPSALLPLRLVRLQGSETWCGERRRNN